MLWSLVQATHAYDNADRLTSLVNARGGTGVSSYAYTYTPNGNRATQTEVNGGRTETTGYTYDALNRIRTIDYPPTSRAVLGGTGDDLVSARVTYGYDPVGNRVSEVTTDAADEAQIIASQSGHFDAVNRLTELTDEVNGTRTTAFTWDANGNQTSKTVGGVTTAYVYDARDKLVEAKQGEGTLSRYSYDFEGRRNLKIGAPGADPTDTLRQYVYDQTSILAEYNASGAEVAKYDYGSDRLVSLTYLGEGRRYYSFDALRSVTNLTDDAGATVASYHLDAWGNFRFPDERAASANRFAFTGYEWDQETGLYNAKARVYDPEIGRFITQDSFLGQIDEPPSLHRYAYGWNRPTFYIDPDGHSVKDALSWGLDFASAFAEDLDQNAGRRAVKVGKAVVSNAAHMVVEAGAQAHDVLVLAADAGKRKVIGEGFDNIELWSDTAEAAGQAFAEGKSTSAVVLGSAKQVAVSTLSAGIIPTVNQQYSALADFSAGKASIEDVENRLADAAGGAILNAGLASYASAKLGYGWRGQSISAEFAQLAQRGSSILSSAKGMIEGGLDSLHNAMRPSTKPLSLFGEGPVPKVAPNRGVGRWTAKEVEGRTVYQARDILDPAKRSSWQDPVTGQWKRGDNVQRMADGLAPIGRDGKSVNLHHLLQEEAGPLAEVPSSLHSKLPHKMKAPGESFRNDPVLKQQYEDFRSEYWKQRSQDFQTGQGQ